MSQSFIGSYMVYPGPTFGSPDRYGQILEVVGTEYIWIEAVDRKGVPQNEYHLLSLREMQVKWFLPDVDALQEFILIDKH